MNLEIIMESWKPTDIERGSVINGDGAICGLDFHKDGRFLVMSTRDTSVHLIDSLTGMEKKKLYTRTCGSGDIKFTHHESCVIMTSDQTKGKKDCDIRYLCMYDNRYLRYFKSHKAPVVSISMSPIEDNFLSASADKSICIWNLNAPGPIAKLQLPANVSNPTVQYDGTGLVFGVMCQDDRSKLHNIKLFDARKYEKGPFQDIVPTSSVFESALTNAMPSLNRQGVQRLMLAPWTNFEFSPDGLHLLVNTASDLLYVLDGFQPKEPVVITARKNENGLALGACFSADARHVLAGNDENDIQIFDRLNGEQKNVLTGHVSPVACIRCNPKYDVIASGCVNTVLWIRPTEGVEPM